jgi:hypothetical protein
MMPPALQDINAGGIIFRAVSKKLYLMKLPKNGVAQRMCLARAVRGCVAQVSKPAVSPASKPT